MAKSKLAGISTDALEAEIERRQRAMSSVQTKRNQLIAELAKLDTMLASAGIRPAQLAKTGGGASSGPRNGKGKAGRVGRDGRRIGGRAKNSQSLSEALLALLKDRTMSVVEMVKKVQEAGYKTTSPNFRTIVNQTLIKDGRFKRVGRGEYTAK
jgi:DNA-binding protein H-NS